MYRLDRAPGISQKGVIFEGLEDDFSLHLVVTPESGIGLAFGSFPGDLPKESETFLEAPITRSPRERASTPEPAVPAASGAPETAQIWLEKESPRSSSARSARSQGSPDASGTTSRMPAFSLTGGC